ncbi:hypothetical protein AX15_007822 [Amanita polypyramis BW_CC]|nr:hypothetical protein AX15_007822 [Amanita polypyramis BW_CC]
MSVSLLVVNPNSSQSVTDGLESNLCPHTPPGVVLNFYTGPKESPLSINNITQEVLSASICIVDLKSKGLLDQYDGFLICCFSDHPLVHMLRELISKPTIGILEAAITRSLLIGKRFGILTTGSGYMYERYNEIQSFMGAKSERFAGYVPTGLGVVELREGDLSHVRREMKRYSSRCAKEGADVIILGCAGMAGMEKVVQDGVVAAGLKPVKVVDGARAGVELLAGLVRLSWSESDADA